MLYIDYLIVLLGVSRIVCRLTEYFCQGYKPLLAWEDLASLLFLTLPVIGAMYHCCIHCYNQHSASTYYLSIPLPRQVFC